MEKRKIYISGKITGIEKYAFEIFESVEKELIKKGYEVTNPMKLPHNHDKSYESYMKEDLKALLECDEIYLLNNWHESNGAIIEFKIASTCGINVIKQVFPWNYFPSSQKK
jgi:hypothetical protein